MTVSTAIWPAWAHSLWNLWFFLTFSNNCFARRNPDHQVSNSEKSMHRHLLSWWVKCWLFVLFVFYTASQLFWIRVAHRTKKMEQKTVLLSDFSAFFHCCWDQNQCCASSPEVWLDTVVGRLTGDGRLFEYTCTQLRGALLWGMVPGPQLLLRWLYSYSNKMWDHSLVRVALPKALTKFWPLVLWRK